MLPIGNNPLVVQPETAAESPVDLPAVPQSEEENDEFLVLDLIYEPIGADANSVQVIHARQLLCASRARIFG